MTDTQTVEPTVEKLEVYNPYNMYSVSQAWNDGKRQAGLGEVIERNPYEEATDADRYKAWRKGFKGKGVTSVAFDAPIPVKGDGVTTQPEWILLEGDEKATPHLVWMYNDYADTADPRVRPLWMQLPNHLRAVQMNTFLNGFVIRGINSGYVGNVELPCPPYTYENEGHKLTIRGGHFSKSGTKPEFEAFIEELQGEVEELTEGEDVSDLYLRATGTVTVQFSVNVPVTELLDGDERMGDEDMWLGDLDSLSEAADEAFQENVSDYVEADDLDYSYGFEDLYVNESYVD